MPVFPSLDWFEEVRCAANAGGALRGLGSCNASVGAKVGDCAYLLSFEGFECAGVKRIEPDELLFADFYLDMPLDEWNALIRCILADGRADAEHSLNRLDLELPGGVVKSADEYRRNGFLRYHLTLQAFFDAAAEVETTFSMTGARA